MQRSAAMAGARRVLVADDDEEMRVVLRLALVDAGYLVTEVSNGHALLAEVRTAVTFGVPSPPDLIISDVRMPGWTGLEVLALMQMLDCRTPVLLITAFGDERIHEIAGELGAVAVFDKPFDVDELVSAVRLQLDQ